MTRTLFGGLLACFDPLHVVVVEQIFAITTENGRQCFVLLELVLATDGAGDVNNVQHRCKARANLPVRAMVGSVKFSTMPALQPGWFSIE